MTVCARRLWWYCSAITATRPPDWRCRVRIRASQCEQLLNAYAVLDFLRFQVIVFRTQCEKRRALVVDEELAIFQSTLQGSNLRAKDTVE